MLEQGARDAKLGIWSGQPDKRKISYTPITDMAGFVSRHQDQELDAVIESVPNGSSLRVLLFLPDVLQIMPISIAGIRCPMVRKDMPNQPDLVEEHGEEAKFYVEAGCCIAT